MFIIHHSSNLCDCYRNFHKSPLITITIIIIIITIIIITIDTARLLDFRIKVKDREKIDIQ